MPIKQPVQKPKPTEAEKEAANDLQSSTSKKSKLKQPIKQNNQKQFRSLKDEHLDGERNSFVKARQLFSSYDPNDDQKEEEDTISMPFIIHDARRIEGKFGPQINFTIQLHGDEERWTLQLSDNDERAKFIQAFRANTEPFGNCALEDRPLANGNSYWKIITHPDSDVPF